MDKIQYLGGEKIKIKLLTLFLITICLLISITSVYGEDNNTQELSLNINNASLSDISMDLENRINNANDNDEIIIEAGTYKIHNININKSITLKGNGNPRDIILDGEEKSSIFLIRNPDVSVTFKNITFVHGRTNNFGGAISSETGQVYVDNCIFINNTALSKTNAGAISNYGTKENRGYLFVNNSLFINNHADHDGGAITTCYADSDIYNCVFINNSAVRDGGAIRVSVYGYGNVQDCIFMFNHADEWGGAYYSWSGESNIERCIFMNNTAGTNGGAVMVSGNINIESSIIVNNNGGETGGSFYIQQPMYDTPTTISVHDNLITNNTSPYGKEVFIKWWDSYNLYTEFDNNDWGDENPNDSRINDPNNVTSRIKVSKTIKSTLFSQLNVNLLDKYSDLLGDFFTDDSLNELKKQFKHEEHDDNKKTTPLNSTNNKHTKTESSTNDINRDFPSNTTTSEVVNTPLNQVVSGNSTAYGESNKAYELNEKTNSVVKQTNFDIRYIIVTIALVIFLLSYGYIRDKRKVNR